MSSFKYIPDIRYDNTKKNVMYVCFAISRYAKYRMTLRLGEKMTVKQAIEVVESWLSKEASQDYYDMVADDLFGDSYEWYFVDGEKPSRGRLLGDCKFLESIVRIDSDTIEIQCGS